MRCFKMVLLVCPLALTALTAADPFSGHWKLNPDKSRLPPPVARGLIVHIEADTKNIRIVEEGIDDKGDLFKLTLSGGFDGKHYGVLNSPSLDTVWFRRLDDHTILGEAHAIRQGNRDRNGGRLQKQEDFNGELLSQRCQRQRDSGKGRA